MQRGWSLTGNDHAKFASQAAAVRKADAGAYSPTASGDGPSAAANGIQAMSSSAATAAAGGKPVANGCTRKPKERVMCSPPMMHENLMDVPACTAQVACSRMVWWDQHGKLARSTMQTLCMRDACCQLAAARTRRSRRRHRRSLRFRRSLLKARRSPPPRSRQRLASSPLPTSRRRRRR